MIFSRKEQRKNVEFLARFIEKHVKPSRFTMSCFRDSCGTTGCALGWSVQSPTLRRRGLGDADPVNFIPTLNGKRITEVGFAETVFGKGAWDNLFSTHIGRIAGTPKRWAAHAREWLRETEGVR